MRLPSEAELTTPMARRIYQYDIRECFSPDPKNYWTIHYRHRLEKILEAMATFVPPGGTILDLGCAQATAAILLAERGFKVTAVDANPESLEYARLRYEYGEITFLCMDVMKLSLEGEFDAILLGEVLEHVPRPGTLVEWCRGLLRAGGILVITTPNGLSPHNWLLPHYEAHSMESPDRADLPSGLGGRETHLHAFRPSELRDLVLRSELLFQRRELLNSYVINPIGLHRLLPLGLAKELNRFCSRIPVLASFTTMTQFTVARKP